MEYVYRNWSTTELMDQYNISRSTVQRLIAKGLPRTKVAGRNCFFEEQMETWFEANPALDPWEWPARTVLSRDTRKVRSLYKQFNAQFFVNRLPHYDVRVVKDIPSDVPCDGLCNRQKGLILIDWKVEIGDPDYRSVLLHEMCHAATPQGLSHGWRFRAQLRRLQCGGETWVQHDLDYWTGDQQFGSKWQRQVARRLVKIADKNPDLTLDQLLNQLELEFSISKGELRKRVPELERGWSRLSFFNAQLANGRGDARVLKRLRLRPEIFGVSR